MALPGCKDCGSSMVGSHKLAVDGKRCDSCYINRKKRLGDNYFCSKCLVSASGDRGRSFALNKGMCEGCYEGRNNYTTVGEKYIRDLYGGGGSGSSGGCFITTATLQSIKSLNDNCNELTSFRNFRDYFLINQVNGEELISKYYEVAPKIVSVIENRKNKAKIYNFIWDKYLKLCLEDINEGRNIQAQLRYVKMVNQLSEEFL